MLHLKGLLAGTLSETPEVNGEKLLPDSSRICSVTITVSLYFSVYIQTLLPVTGSGQGEGVLTLSRAHIPP